MTLAFEIERELKKYPLRITAYHPESYIGGGQSKLRYLGLRVPELHQALKNGFSFSDRSQEEQAKIWDEVWFSSDCYEVMALALSWFYHPKQSAFTLRKWPLLKPWSSRIDNWAHGDALCAIYARIHEEDSAKLYPTFQKWNSSKNPWLRRLSMVSLIYYSSQREKVLPAKQILSLVEPQLDHEHYYVQKGVGWTLRECHNVYPRATYSFLERNISRLSSYAFSASTEKMSPSKKSRLKLLRRSR